MRIAILFHIQGERQPAAVTEVEGALTDVLLPSSGDTVSHCDFAGRPFQGRVVERHFDYALATGADITGMIAVTLSLERILLN